MQFVNIVVHSVEDMNFRVHLQHEFTLLGLDSFLEVTCVRIAVSPIGYHESADLHIPISYCRASSN